MCITTNNLTWANIAIMTNLHVDYVGIWSESKSFSTWNGSIWFCFNFSLSDKILIRIIEGHKRSG